MMPPTKRKRVMKRSDIVRIVVHCTGTDQYKFYDVESYPRDGFDKCPYHFVVHQCGSISNPRAIDELGAGARGYNKGSIHVAYVGGLGVDGTPADTRTSAQKSSLDALVRALRQIFPDANVLGHRDLPGVAKACPCFNASKEYEI